MPSPVIQFDGVSFSYHHHEILLDVGFAVQEHEFVTIVGPNGGGKTTLLRLMMGVLHPARGSVRVFGKRPEDARNRIGYMAQHSHLDPQFPVRVLEVALMGRIGYAPTFGPYTKADKDAAREALDILHMGRYEKTHFSELSGGQRQRVLIARALASKPDLLLLDEPTAGLDLAVEAELYDLLRRLTEQLTVVVVSHDLGFVSQYVDKVICVKHRVAIHPTCEVCGKIIQELYGAPMRMVRHDRLNSGACES
jgi:zinc transport system ATP-binding protein